MIVSNLQNSSRIEVLHPLFKTLFDYVKSHDLLHAELTRENARLKQLLAEKDEEIKQVENSRKELEAMYTNLKMARTISIHDNDIKDTKQRLSKLVREVDRCIALLKGQ